MSQTFFATGSRKTATARVWLVQGESGATINNKPCEQYFGRADLVRDAMAPLQTTSTAAQFGMKAKVAGGGLSSQADAIALGAARALVAFNPELRKPLKDASLLKRDPREKERMKYGLAKRRKRFQWTKR